jgi:hypothetical protein
MGLMERADGPRTPYESYCYQCRVTFPVGTRRCVHCGGPIGRRDPKGGLLAPPEPHVADEAPQEPSVLRRMGSISLWVLIAIGAALSRMCQEG